MTMSVKVATDMVEIIYLSQLVPFGTTVDPQVCILIDCSTRSNPPGLDSVAAIPLDCGTMLLLCHVANYYYCHNVIA